MSRTDEGWEAQPGRRSGPRTIGQAARELPNPQGGQQEYKPAGHETQWAMDFANEYKSARGVAEVKVAENWKQRLPKGSKWEPGMLGKPDCAMCLGMGFVSVDLPVGHPKHGKLLYCECRRRDDYPRLQNA